MRDDVGVNSVPHHAHALGLKCWAAMSCCLLVGGPVDGVASADAEGGYYVVAAVFDVSCDGGVVDLLVVDAGECFGLAEGDHVGVECVYGFGSH